MEKQIKNLDSSDKVFAFTLTKKAGSKDGYSDEECRTAYTANDKTIEITGVGADSFGPVYFNEPGTYVYIIREDDFDYPGYTRDQSEYEVTFTVTDIVDQSGSHVLSSTHTYRKVKGENGEDLSTVSYTHLTLPTILRV